MYILPTLKGDIEALGIYDIPYNTKYVVDLSTTYQNLQYDLLYIKGEIFFIEDAIRSYADDKEYVKKQKNILCQKIKSKNKIEKQLNALLIRVLTRFQYKIDIKK